jgi:hypothetical protein
VLVAMVVICRYIVVVYDAVMVTNFYAFVYFVSRVFHLMKFCQWIAKRSQRGYGMVDNTVRKFKN